MNENHVLFLFYSQYGYSRGRCIKLGDGHPSPHAMGVLGAPWLVGSTVEFRGNIYEVTENTLVILNQNEDGDV